MLQIDDFRSLVIWSPSWILVLGSGCGWVLLNTSSRVMSVFVYFFPFFFPCFLRSFIVEVIVIGKIDFRKENLVLLVLVISGHFPVFFFFLAWLLVSCLLRSFSWSKANCRNCLYCHPFLYGRPLCKGLICTKSGFTPYDIFILHPWFESTGLPCPFASTCPVLFSMSSLCQGFVAHSPRPHRFNLLPIDYHWFFDPSMKPIYTLIFLQPLLRASLLIRLSHSAFGMQTFPHSQHWVLHLPGSFCGQYTSSSIYSLARPMEIFFHRFFPEVDLSHLYGCAISRNTSPE